MAAPNVWTQMNYVPPRGQCNYKQSVLSPKCPCLRFMLHPLKVRTSHSSELLYSWPLQQHVKVLKLTNYLVRFILRMRRL
jgi:hypothetical protein